MSTIPEVFIIESLKFDEENDYREGELIYRSLRMAGKEPRYCYIRTREELEHFVDVFEDSNYRYLHISCHGFLRGISTTLNDLPRKQFIETVASVLDSRRLFLSTCLATTEKLANGIFSTSSCNSVAGPAGTIYFDDSVILWTSFYHLMFKENSKGMSRTMIKRNLAKSALLVNENIHFFAPSRRRKAILSKLPAKRNVGLVSS